MSTNGQKVAALVSSSPSLRASPYPTALFGEWGTSPGRKGLTAQTTCNRGVGRRWFLLQEASEADSSLCKSYVILP